MSNLTEFKKTTNNLIFRNSKQSMGAKILRREGNSPDYSLRPSNFSKWERM